MKILMLHNRYREPGGEDLSFEADAALLEAHGHTVDRYVVSNESLAGMGRLRAAAGTIYSRVAAQEVRRRIKAFRPDVMHVQNFFAVLSPSVHRVAHAMGVPVVQTLRNYRLLCTNAQFLRDGRVCELCKRRRFAWPGIRYACYRNSRSASAVVAAMSATHRMLGTWRRCVSRYIALTEFSKRLFVEGGFPEDRIEVRPNFLAPDPGSGPAERTGVVFVGMLHPWKGADVAIRAWRGVKSDEALTIVGSGPEEAALRDLATGDPRVRFAGRLDAPGVLAVLKQARCAVFPSIWYETFGRTIIESFASGTPVMASDLGSASELVEDGVTGRHFRTGDAEDLAEKLGEALAAPGMLPAMGRRARAVFLERYTADAAYERLMEIYEKSVSCDPPSPLRQAQGYGATWL